MLSARVHTIKIVTWYSCIRDHSSVRLREVNGKVVFFPHLNEIKYSDMNLTGPKGWCTMMKEQVICSLYSKRVKEWFLAWSWPKLKETENVVILRCHSQSTKFGLVTTHHNSVPYKVVGISDLMENSPLELRK